MMYTTSLVQVEVFFFEISWVSPEFCRSAWILQYIQLVKFEWAERALMIETYIDLMGQSLTNVLHLFGILGTSLFVRAHLLLI